MIYMTPQRSPGVVRDGFGQILTPPVVCEPRYSAWCADNGMFTGKVGKSSYLPWLGGMLPYRSSCLFATVVDVVGDAVATLDYYRLWAWRIRVLGYPVALVAQDGLESLRWPPEYDVLFVGGSTDWKMSDAADWCIRRAKSMGKWVHVGRVNSRSRLRHFWLIGVDSVDGTHVVYEPDVAYERIESWLAQPPLFEI